ncbi:MAG: hypothetical protein KKH04_19325 [Proteobacteria bacterium]|nr:hypothetical protein [Pseudomonadota bacterium]
MAFLIFERGTDNIRPILKPTGESFRLAGYNLIHQAWQNRGRPMQNMEMMK